MFCGQERFEALEAAKLAVEDVYHSTQAAVQQAEAELRVVMSAAAAAADEGSARAQEQVLVQEKLQVRSGQIFSELMLTISTNYIPNFRRECKLARDLSPVCALYCCLFTHSLVETSHSST